MDETDQLAEHAVADIEDGMLVGLGTGRAASRGIHALAHKVHTHNLSITCVATSLQSATLAESLGLTVLAMRDIPALDILFDGVDELDPNLAMTKGAGGAMTREKIVAEAARMRIYMMQRSKVVSHLGEHFRLPVEVLEFGLASIQRRLIDEIKLSSCEVRMNGDDGSQVYRTDEGNLVLDCAYGDSALGDLNKLDTSLNNLPGVIGHGLFVSQADIVLIEKDDGSGELECRKRSP